MWKCLPLLFVAILAAPAVADVYNDTAGDVFTGAGAGILDILSAEVTNTATDIQFKLTFAGDVDATDWGKYILAINSLPGGDPVSNGWGRPISYPAGLDYWLGSWVDSGNGIQTWNYSGAGPWNTVAANGPFAGPGGTPANSPDVSVSKAANMVTITASLSSLGLALGNTIFFDAFTSGGGGGDGAIDSLGNPMQQVGDWGEHSDAHPLSYTLVPEPTTIGLLALGAAAFVRRRRR